MKPVEPHASHSTQLFELAFYVLIGVIRGEYQGSSWKGVPLGYTRNILQADKLTLTIRCSIVVQ